MLQAIVGLEREVSSMLGKWKVSQNQPENNKPVVIAGLSQAQITMPIQWPSLLKLIQVTHYSELIETSFKTKCCRYCTAA